MAINERIRIILPLGPGVKGGDGGLADVEILGWHGAWSHEHAGRGSGWQGENPYSVSCRPETGPLSYLASASVRKSAMTMRWSELVVVTARQRIGVKCRLA